MLRGVFDAADAKRIDAAATCVFCMIFNGFPVLLLGRSFSMSESCAHVCEESPLDRLFLQGCQPFFG